MRAQRNFSQNGRLPKRNKVRYRSRDKFILTLHDDAEDDALVHAHLGRLSNGDVDPADIVGGAASRPHGVLVGLEQGVEGAHPGAHGWEVLPRARVVLRRRLDADLIGSVLGQELDGPVGEVGRDGCGEGEGDGGHEAEEGELGEHCDGLSGL